MSALGNWVKAQPTTVTEVALRLGIGRVALYRYLEGRVMPRPPVAARIERETGGAVTSADLVRDYRGRGSAE